MMIRIVIADDHKLFRMGIEGVLKADGSFDIVASVTNGKLAVDEVLRLHPDLVLMDAQMPVCNGISALRQIHKAQRDVRVVMLTASDEDELVIEALREGASGFLLKDTDPEKICDYLRSVYCGETVLSDAVTKKLVGQLAGREHSEESPAVVVSVDDQEAVPFANIQEFSVLSNQERRVLALVAEGLNNREIGAKLFLSENTVKIHLSNILSKLHLTNRVQAAVYAIQYGSKK